MKPPTVPLSCQASAISSTGATVSATINPSGLPTTYHVGYGTTAAYGSSTPDRQLAAGSQDDPVSAVLGGLRPGTIYHCRTVASSAAGTTYGSDQTFTVRRAAASLRLRSARLGAARAGCRARSSRAARACGVALVMLSGTIDKRADGEWVIVSFTAVGRSAKTMTISARVKARAGRWRVAVRLPGGSSPSTQRWRLKVSYRGDRFLLPARLGRELRPEITRAAARRS